MAPTAVGEANRGLGMIPTAVGEANGGLGKVPTAVGGANGGLGMIPTAVGEANGGLGMVPTAVGGASPEMPACTAASRPPVHSPVRKRGVYSVPPQIAPRSGALLHRGHCTATRRLLPGAF